MRSPLPPQLQSVQALLTPQRMLRAHLVRRLRGRDVNLGVLGGGLSWEDTRTDALLTLSKRLQCYDLHQNKTNIV